MATTLNAGAGGALTNISIRANGMFDPEVAVGGHQPMAFDEMGALYNHFTVTKAHICVTAINSSGYNMIMVLNTYPNSTFPSTTDDALEYPGAVWRVVQTDNTNGASQSMATLKKSCDMSKYFNKPRSQLINSSLYRGTIAADPTEQAYFTFSAQNMTGTEDPLAIELNIVVTYEAVWTEAVRIAGS